VTPANVATMKIRKAEGIREGVGEGGRKINK
jgi:hypothetical protein